MAKKNAKVDAKVDELVELLKDDKVTQLLIEKLDSPTIEDMLERKLDKIIEKILLKINPIIEKSVNDLMSAQLQKLNQKQAQLEQENDQLRVRLDQFDTEARLSSLVIHGLVESEVAHESKEAAEREATQATLTLCNSTLGLPIVESDIASAYRLPKKGKEKQRPVIVRFESSRIRNLIYKARFQLKKTSVFINEYLTPKNAQLYARTRGLVREGRATSTWTASGLVYLKLTSDLGAKPIKILSLKELQELLPTADQLLSNLPTTIGFV